MKFITKEAIDSLDDKYYEGRYGYIKEVINQIKLMDNIDTTVELGPYKSPLVVGGDIVDITDKYLNDIPIKIGKFYKHNCAVTPFPFKDKQYDLVIVCHVLEHLGTNQREVFKELCRISRNAIITLPYKWNIPCDVHHMLDEKVIDNWAHGLKPEFEHIFSDPPRILRIYNFDNITKLGYNKKLYEGKLNTKKQKYTSKISEREEKVDIQNQILKDKLYGLNKQVEYYQKNAKCLQKKHNKNIAKIRILEENAIYTKKQLILIANTRPYRIAYFLRRFSHEFWKGDIKNKKDFLKWIYCKLAKKDCGLESKYNPLIELVKKKY